MDARRFAPLCRCHQPNAGLLLGLAALFTFVGANPSRAQDANVTCSGAASATPIVLPSPMKTADDVSYSVVVENDSIVSSGPLTGQKVDGVLGDACNAATNLCRVSGKACTPATEATDCEVSLGVLLAESLSNTALPGTLIFNPDPVGEVGTSGCT